MHLSSEEAASQTGPGGGWRVIAGVERRREHGLGDPIAPL